MTSSAEAVTGEDWLPQKLRGGAAFQRKIDLDIRFGEYLVKTLENRDEVCTAFALRKKVFCQSGFVDDAYCLEEADFLGDHLAVIDLRSGELVAACALFSASRIGFLPSARAWTIGEMQATVGGLLELDWFCVEPRYTQRRALLKMLIGAVLDYALLSGDRYFIGELGVASQDAALIAQVRFYLEKQGYLSDAFHVHPHTAQILPDIDSASYFGDSRVEALIPALYYFCFKRGAKAAPIPRIVSQGGIRTDFFLFGNCETARLKHGHGSI